MPLISSQLFSISANNIDYPNPVNRKHNLANGLLAWWLCLPTRMGSVKWYDIVGTNHGTLTSMAQATNGFRGSSRKGGFGSMLLDGTAGYVYESIANFGGTTLTGTITAWINTSTASGYICGTADEGGNANYLYMLAVTGVSTTNITVEAESTLNGYRRVRGGTNIGDGKWHHVAVMSNGSAYLLFVDGKQEIATAVTNSNDGLWLSGPINRDNVTIGARQRGGVIADSFLAGNVDDVRFYNRALSANEINQLYQNSQQGYPNLINRTTKRIWNGSVNIVNYPNGPNTSQPIIRNNLKQNQLVNRRSSLNNGLLAWWLCVPGRMGAGKWFDLLNTFHGKFGDPALVFKPNTRQGGFGSVQFDATVLHDVLIGGNMAKLSPANNTNGNITAMAWFNSSAIGAGQCIFAMASAGGTARLDLGLGQSGGGFNKLSAVLRDGSGNSTVPQSQTIINPNTWYHVALIKRGTSGELYINGVFNASNSNASMGAIDTTSGNIRIGAFAFNEASTFSGRIDDVRIYGRDLVPKEIQQVYLDSLSGYQKTLGKISTRLNTYANSGFISPPINLGIKGIDVKQTSKQLVIRTLLVDLNGNQVTSGNTLMSIYEVQSDGSIKTFDFNNNAFTTGSVVKSQANMVHRTTNNRTFNTGIWTYSLAQLQGFNVGSVYISQITNTNAFPAVQAKEFQYGDAQGDDGAFVKFIITPGSTNLTIKTNRSEATSFWNNSLIAFSTGSLRGISARVLSYTSGSFTLKTSLPSTPSIGDSGVIIGSQ